MPPIQPAADDLVLPFAEKLVQHVGGQGRFHFAFVVINVNGRTGAIRCKRGVKARRNFHRRADSFLGNPVCVVRFGRDDLECLDLAQGGDRFRRIFPAQQHDFGRRLPRLPDNPGGHHSDQHHQARQHEHRHHDHRYDRAPVPQQVAHLLEINNLDRMARHFISSTTLIKMSSRL